MKLRQWYRVENAAADPAVVDIHIIDFIGGWDEDWIARNWGYDMGVTARQFVEALAALDPSVKTIRLHINSPGGDVWGAVNIANALRDQQATKGRAVETIVDGLAASAASIVMMAGNPVRIADNALVMVHNPMTIAAGNAADLRKAAAALDTVRGQILATYQWHSPLEDAALIALLDAETWMNADEAVANGFATEKVAGLQAAASLDGRALAKLSVPEQYRARVEAWLKREAPAPTAATPADVLAAVDAAGFSAAFARELVDANLTMAQVTARIEAATTDRTQREARATEIRGLCATARLPELAEDYIAGSMPVDAIKRQLTTLTAKLDAFEIVHHPPVDGRRQAPVIDISAVYGARNSSR